MTHNIPSSVLRHESKYEVKAELTNEELTFLKSDTVQFSPSKCKWFTVVGEGVSDGYRVLEVSPGTEDIKFQLALEHNSELECNGFDFFDAFSGLDFDFIMTDTTDYISYKPKMEVRAYDPTVNASEV